MRNEESEFSSLKTVTSFDRGENCTLAAVDVSSQEIQPFSPSSLLVESLIEQICKLMEKDSDNQKKLYLTVCEKLREMRLIGDSYGVEEFQFMRNHYQKALYQLLAIARTTSIENKALIPKNSCPMYFSRSGVVEWSRYNAEFQELEYIAKGGFGYVYKARHKLDGEMYAVKKIHLRFRSVNDFLQNLREVKMLAKLNHPNIVSYKAAWLESSDEQTKDQKHNPQKLPALPNKGELYESSPSGNDGSLEVIFEGSEQSFSVLDVNETSSRSTSQSNASTASRGVALGQITCRKQVYQFTYCEEEFNSKKQSATLFIQMQLCERTMRHWLDHRNQTIIDSPLNVDQAVEIFKKVVKGVDYIHSQGIVHHDIKPSNIFVSEDLSVVQVGDFGLACYLLAHPSSSHSIVAAHPRGQVGTRLYAAPEQLKGTCHPKSDVYSLGIVLLELLQPFCTVMERSEVINQLRCGHIPTQLAATHPNLARIISETVTSLRHRPTSSELLKTLEELQSAEAVTIVAKQSELIEQLRRESRAKDEEIDFLKKQLAQLISKSNGVSH